jgi:hypothetical protein
MTLQSCFHPLLLLVLFIAAAGCMGMEPSHVTPEEAVAIALADPEVRQQIAGEQYEVTGIWPGIFEGQAIYDIRITVTSGQYQREIRYFVGKDGTPLGLQPS